MTAALAEVFVRGVNVPGMNGARGRWPQKADGDVTVHPDFFLVGAPARTTSLWQY